MEKQKIVKNLSRLGDFFEDCLKEVKTEGDSDYQHLVEQGKELIQQAQHHNAWFTPTAVKTAYSAWSATLNDESIEKWLKDYPLTANGTGRAVGVIMAGNIPMVGLHDAICVLASGHQLRAKLSSKDDQLMKLALEVMAYLDEKWKENIHLVDQLKQAELLIATGNDNSSRYFEYYFRKLPKILRKNRTGIGLLSQDVSDQDLEGLSRDVFTYFGLGCRNVTKLYLPGNFDLDRLFKAFYPFKDIIHHHQYANNYDYNKAVYLMNQIELRENGFLLMKEDEGLHSPLGVLFYEYYEALEKVNTTLEEQRDEIQLVVSDVRKDSFKVPGEAQRPELWDYADGVDTLAFLLEHR